MHIFLKQRRSLDVIFSMLLYYNYYSFISVANIRIRYLKELITYVGNANRNIANLSRINPALLLLSSPFGKWKTQFVVYKNNRKPALCFTIGLAVNDSIRTPLSFNSKGETLWQKSISIVPITMEIERLISTICTILNIEEYWAQFDDNALKFVTVPGNLKNKRKLCFVLSWIFKIL
jgi:hypothetical protein